MKDLYPVLIIAAVIALVLGAIYFTSPAQDARRAQAEAALEAQRQQTMVIRHQQSQETLIMFVVVVIVLAILAGGGLLFFDYIQARRYQRSHAQLPSPPPQPLLPPNVTIIVLGDGKRRSLQALSDPDTRTALLDIIKDEHYTDNAS